MELKGIGGRIRQMRELRGLSARELTRRLDGVISQAGLSRIENGTKNPDAAELLALAWALGVAVSELVDECPLSERVQWAARSEQQVDVRDVRERLLPYLQLRNIVSMEPA
ncbi:helix-turn-helix domain-containing protein [Trueperella bialowiezensis]|uniref:helix-turn-helix domain-containing protein n=1 Tax=Trueperella bialowiezensis TaxID=312285 RepID=UPI002410DDDD|nr:helix-turn-helix transcriptional regulator [Trueperella bialowiezensis]